MRLTRSKCRCYSVYIHAYKGTAMASRTTDRKSSVRPSVCTCVNVRRASRAITRIYDKALEPAELKITQFSVLANLAHSGPLSVTKLAGILKLDRTTLVRNLKALQAAGFIENTAGSDPRERAIGITESGRAVVERARPHWEVAQKLVEEQIGREGLQQLKSLLVTLEKLCDGSDLQGQDLANAGGDQ